jgi:DNA-binding NarL/FixJ family response regulator
MRILVVDRLPLIHEALRALLSGLAGSCEVVGAADESTAWACLATQPEIDLAVIEVPAEASQASFDFIARLHARRAGLPILALGAVGGPAPAAQAIATGACGYVPRSAPAPVLIAATRLALARTASVPERSAPLPAGFAATPAESAAAAWAGGADPGRSAIRLPGRIRPAGALCGQLAEAPLRLTARQSEVLALLAEGKPNKLICRELKLSEGTVKVHVSAVLRALKVANRTQAALAVAGLGVSARPHEEIRYGATRPPGHLR